MTKEEVTKIASKAGVEFMHKAAQGDGEWQMVQVAECIITDELHGEKHLSRIYWPKNAVD